MVSQSSKSVILSILVSELDNDTFSITASSNRLETNPTASLPAAVLKQLISSADELRQTSLPSLEKVKDLGCGLFEALIRGQVRDLYRMLEGQNVDGLNFHLVLDLQPHLLQQLPWECMYDPFWGEYISLRDNTHILRKVQQKQAAAAPREERGYTNLVIAIANARGQPTINPQRERDLIDLAVGDLHQKGLLNGRYIQGSQQEMKAALRDVPDVFHFVGHGGFDKHDVPVLYLEDSNGDAIAETATSLEQQYFTPPPEIDRRIGLVILSACQTSETPKTEGYNSLAHQLASQVDTVLAMQYPIGLENLTEYNKALYLALANGAPLETAVNAARRSIIKDKPGGARDWIAPVLVTHQESTSDLLRLANENPFKGRKNYDTDDRERFFGREQELKELDTLYKSQKVVVVRGESGCGKTSLLKAGWMGRVKSAQQPLVYLRVGEDLETQLRLEINKILGNQNRLPLPEGELDQLTGDFPVDLAILLDRFEQVELLSEQIDQIVTSLIEWAVDPAPERRRARLVIATRLNERGEEPGLLQRLLPDEQENKRLDLKMLGWDQAVQCIEWTTRKTDISFPLETIHAILNGLKYNQPEERSMTALQVVCMEVYKRARSLPDKIAIPLLVENQVDGILEQEFNIKIKLKKIVDERGEAARMVLAQFVGSDKQSMRPRSWDELRLRCCLDEHQLKLILDMLQEEGLVRLEPQPIEEKYELVHETLTRQMDWLTPADVELRNLEEIVDSTQTLIPLKSEKGGLEDLDKRRAELTLSEKHQQLVLRSALEAGHETDYWFRRIQNPELALSVLTSPYLSRPAQERACGYLGIMAAKEGEFGEKAKEKLLAWACASESPRLSRAASLALAPLVDAAFVNQHFGAARGDLKPAELGALAVMYDAHGLPLKSLAKLARRQVYRTIVKNNSVEILSSTLRAASLGALGFALAAAWVYAQVYFGSQTRGLPPFYILILELLLVGLLSFILALPGSLCAPSGRNLSLILSGGRRSLPAALGTLLGSLVGTGLTIALVAALAEYHNPSWLRLARYFVSGALLGAAIALPWLLSVRFSLKHAWLVLLAGLCGALVFTGVSQWENWWPAASFALSIKGPYVAGARALAGGLIGLGSALGLVWGRLGGVPGD